MTSEATAPTQDRTLALLLALAAVVAAIVGARAATLSGEAANLWQGALRKEIQRSAATGEDIRFVYSSEGRSAWELVTARVRAEEARAEAERREGEEREALLFEADVHAGVVDALTPAVEMAGDPAFAREDGGFDLVARLAANRGRFPDLVAIDPDADQRAGDRLADHALLTALAAIPVGATFLFGALGQPFKSRRRDLRAVAAVSLALGVVAAIAIEVLA